MQLNTILQDLGTAGALAENYQAGGLSLQVKTNLTPALTLYTEGSGTPAPGASSVARLLGIQGGARVVDAAGNVIMQVGTWPQTDPVRVALAVGAGALLTWGLFRLVRGGRRR